jgi:transcriptional regulator with XRE-family HTH domain
MEAINSRIIELRNHLGLKQTHFAQEIGVTSQLINKIEAGNAKVTETNIRIICFTFKVNEEWLREGKGDMMDEEAQLSEWERRLLAFFRELSPQARKMLYEYAEMLLSNEKALRGEASQNAPGGTTRPLEAPQEAKPAQDTEKGESPGIGPNPKNGETG